jgi:glycosyltransferase involved in cell wall biosynthesis
MSKKIIIIGSYPPPYGGISVHIERVLLYLKKDEYVFYNEQKSSCPNAKSFNNKWKYCKAFSFLFKKFKLIHYHTPNNRMRTIFCFIGAVKKKIYIHIHG